MRDRHREDAIAELFRDDPELAAAILSAAEPDCDESELAIIRRQLAKVAELAPKEKGEKQP
jgi:hypothetical protein